MSDKIEYNGEVMTARQFAKHMILNFGEGGYYWQERIDDDTVMSMTLEDSDVVVREIDKQYNRVRKFLNID